MGVRLIAIDVDGTLLDSRHELPAANREAICAAAQSGIEVAFVTGRRYDFAMPIALQIPCPITMIVNNGALVKNKDGATHLRHLLARETARLALAETAGCRDSAAVCFDRPRENQVIWERIDWADEQRRGYFERNRAHIAEMHPLENCLTEDPIQVMFTGPVAEMRAIEAKLRASAFAAEMALARTEYAARDFSLVDVLRPGVSKGATLKDWARQRGYEREEVMAIGDNFNDIEMLEFAGVPVVMGNAVAELKSNGWRVAPNNDEAGVAAAIREFALPSADG